jgi:hypothetical protein
MTLHYHGTPISPRYKLAEIAGAHFCVSHAAPGDVEICHRIGQSVMLDNGAFSAWTAGKPTDWPAYYKWCDRWLDYPTTWAVIPDTITGDMSDNDDLIAQWPFGRSRSAPVWHLHEGICRLLHLINDWPLVCMGSSGKYATVLSSDWCRRMDLAWNAISKEGGRTPRVHMLRGMQLVKREWPFYSVDSTDIARNHNRVQNEPEDMARRWDSEQCPPIWLSREQLALEGGFYERETA